LPRSFISDKPFRIIIAGLSAQHFRASLDQQLTAVPWRGVSSFSKDARAVFSKSLDRAFSQEALDPVDDSTDHALIETPAYAYVKVGAILTPVLQSDKELVLDRMLGGSPLLLLQLLVLEKDLEHAVERMTVNAAQPLEVFRLQVFDLFVGHELLYLNLLRFDRYEVFSREPSQ
jgi:hypothetical protein